MNFEQFSGSMGRILSFTAAPKTPSEIDNLQRYLKALFEAIGNMDAFTFEKVTVELCKNMGRGQRPMPGQFWAVYHRLKSEDMAGRPVEVCQSCKNTTWVYLTMMEQGTGMYSDFCEPCPGCQSRHPFKDAPPKAGWVRVETAKRTHDEKLIEAVHKMGSRGARYVLDLAEKFKVNYSDAVLDALILKAGDEQPQENAAAEAALAGIKVVAQ